MLLLLLLLLPTLLLLLLPTLLLLLLPTLLLLLLLLCIVCLTSPSSIHTSHTHSPPRPTAAPAGTHNKSSSSRLSNCPA
jgi:hypothetical protein